MTEIILENISDRYVVNIKGHANYDEYGRDVVCAAISALAQSFIYYCESMQDLNRCTVLDESVESGRLRVVVEGGATYIQPAYEMMRIGLSAIAENYPRYVYLGGEKSA